MSGLQFKPQLIDKIKGGAKTQTRRPVKWDDLMALGYVDGRFPDDPDWQRTVERVSRWKAGRSYAIQPGRGRVQVGRVTVTAVRVERLGDLGAEDARREGFARKGIGSTSMFFDYWRDLYGDVDEDQFVWVISFVYGHDQLRLLSTPVPGRSGDYTTALAQTIDEGAEGVDEASQQRFTEQAHRSKGQQHLLNRARRERYELERRLERAVSDAAARGVDISSPLRVIERQLQKIERRVYEGKAA